MMVRYRSRLSMMGGPPRATDSTSDSTKEMSLGLGGRYVTRTIPKYDRFHKTRSVLHWWIIGIVFAQWCESSPITLAVGRLLR